jgi:hypothetical protein
MTKNRDPSKTSDYEAIEFRVETKFQRLAKRSGGIPRDRAIKNAEVNVSDFKTKFKTWLDEEIDALRDALPADQAAARDLDWIDTADLHCQFVADVAATMDFEMVSFVAKNLCLIFDAVKKGAPYRHDIVMCYLNTLLLASREEHRTMKPDDMPELASGLRRVLESVAPEAVA